MSLPDRWDSNPNRCPQNGENHVKKYEDGDDWSPRSGDKEAYAEMMREEIEAERKHLEIEDPWEGVERNQSSITSSEVPRYLSGEYLLDPGRNKSLLKALSGLLLILSPQTAPFKMLTTRLRALPHDSGMGGNSSSNDGASHSLSTYEMKLDSGGGVPPREIEFDSFSQKLEHMQERHREHIKLVTEQRMNAPPPSPSKSKLLEPGRNKSLLKVLCELLMLLPQQSAPFKILNTRLKALPPDLPIGGMKISDDGASHSHITDEMKLDSGGGVPPREIEFASFLQQLEHMQERHREHVKLVTEQRMNAPPPSPSKSKNVQDSSAAGSSDSSQDEEDNIEVGGGFWDLQPPQFDADDSERAPRTDSIPVVPIRPYLGFSWPVALFLIFLFGTLGSGGSAPNCDGIMSIIVAQPDPLKALASVIIYMGASYILH